MTTFGLFINTGAQTGRTHADVFALALAQAELAESLGYHDVWVTEHHFIPFGINANALTLAGFLLGRTNRLRVGTAVTLAPLYHPLQLAEQVAILDQVSGGRLDFGIGRGGYLIPPRRHVTMRMGSLPSQPAAALRMCSKKRPLLPLMSEISITLPEWPAVSK